MSTVYFLSSWHTQGRRKESTEGCIVFLLLFPPFPFLSSPSLPLFLCPLPTLFFPFFLSYPFLDEGPLKPARGLESAASSPSGVRADRRSPGQKRIWCTLELSESHWWQSFWVFWIACLYYMESKTRLDLSWGVFLHPSPPPTPLNIPTINRAQLNMVSLSLYVGIPVLYLLMIVLL